MKIVRMIAGVLVFAAVTWGSAYAVTRAPGVKVSLDKRTVTVGEKFRYSITVATDARTEVKFPDLTNAFKDLTVVDSGQAARSFLNRKTYTLWVILQSFDPGTYPILKQQIQYKGRNDAQWGTALTGSITVTVISLLTGTGAAAELADIKGPLDIRTALPGIILACAVVLILGIVFRKQLFPAQKRAQAAIQPWKAHEIAYSQLDELRRKGFLARGLIKQYYSALSDILRHYLENRFSLRAPEMTTEEFIAYVRESSELGREQKDLLKEFLMNCDLVKFAKYIPPDSEGTVAFDTAMRFVDQTKAEAGDRNTGS